MATKNLSLNRIKTIGDAVFADWEQEKRDIRVSATTLFRLISLKTKLNDELVKAQEAVAAIAHNCGGVDQEDGTIKVPEERMADANRALRELGEENIEIEYSPIIIREGDEVPITLMEALLDFIEIQE